MVEQAEKIGFFDFEFGQAVKTNKPQKIKEKKMAFIFGIIALLVGALFVLFGVMPDSDMPGLGRIISVVVGIFLILASLGAAFA